MKSKELRELRAKKWEGAKAFLDTRRGENGLLSAEDDAAYTKMEQEIMDLGKEIERQERLEAMDRELAKPISTPIVEKPMTGEHKEKKGRFTEEYATNFWNMMGSKIMNPAIVNALQEGDDSEGGYLVPDEYEHTLIEALEEEGAIPWNTDTGRFFYDLACFACWRTGGPCADPAFLDKKYALLRAFHDRWEAQHPEDLYRSEK